MWRQVEEILSGVNVQEFHLKGLMKELGACLPPPGSSYCLLPSCSWMKPAWSSIHVHVRCAVPVLCTCADVALHPCSAAKHYGTDLAVKKPLIKATAIQVPLPP